MSSYGMLNLFSLVAHLSLSLLMVLAVPVFSEKIDSVKTGAPVRSQKVIKNIRSLDTTKIHAQYMEGEFVPAIKTLESSLKSNQPKSHADSVFIFKHLGVMHAASPGTRERGKFFMYQLINIEPTAKILDMYASDLIFLIFRNVQEDFELKNGQAIVSSRTILP
jgi:hypothetical protein